LARLRNELFELSGEREARLYDLGAAVYAHDEQATQALIDEISRVDDATQQREAQMHAVAEAAQERIRKGRLSVQPTLIETPTPEPAPPPDEGTPPQPPLIPEPGPPPDEGTPPSPEPVPEPGLPDEF